MNIKPILLSLVLAAASATSLDAQTVVNHYATDAITDLGLIWIGGQHRPEWTKELLTPYVTHTYADGRMTWFFDGFLMLEGTVWDASGSTPYRLSSGGIGGPSTKAVWEYVLEKQLGTNDGNGCRALDNVIEDMIPILGTPSHKHKVVMYVPMPIRNLMIWGRIDGKALDFSEKDDRVKAMQWYADLIERRWNEENFKNLELEGVYWVDEDLYNSDDMILAMSPYYHAKGWKIYWIPYFNSNRLRNFWADYGIDVTYLQPNYYFRSDTPMEQLLLSPVEAYTYGMGLEFEFEGYDGKSMSPSYNSGLYDCHPEFYQRLVDYVDVFENYGAFNDAALSWYSGYKGFYDFSLSSHPKDIEIMDRIALLVENRHIAAGWHERHNGGIDTATLGTDGRCLAYGGNGFIYIADAIACETTVYTLDGRIVHSQDRPLDTESLNYGMTVKCPAGIYIVSSPACSVKVHVR